MASSKIVQAVRRSQALGPSVRNLLSQYQLDLSKITSSGPHQTVLKSDVLNYLQQKKVNQTEPVTVGSKIFTAPTELALKSKFARVPLSELEIEMINSGGAAMS